MADTTTTGDTTTDTTASNTGTVAATASSTATDTVSEVGVAAATAVTNTATQDGVVASRDAGLVVARDSVSSDVADAPVDEDGDNILDEAIQHIHQWADDVEVTWEQLKDKTCELFEEIRAKL
jgi:hypothetical protein